MATDQRFDDEGITIVVDQKSVGIDDCNEQDSEVVSPENMETETKKINGRRIKQCGQRGQTCKRKKPELDYNSCSDSEGERDKDEDFDPTVPEADGRKTRVRGRRGSAMKRTPEVPGDYPIYVRRMVKSNVNSVFLLHISSTFCRRYLPKHDVEMTLEDEYGECTYANYISGIYGLSGGWKTFALGHRLKVRDTVVFQLVTPSRFKVYIKREKEFTTTDDDVRSKELTTGGSSSSLGVGDDANNLAAEEALDDFDGMRFPHPDIEDISGMRSSTDQRPSVDHKGYEEFNVEKGCATEKMRTLMSKLATIKDDLKAMEAEMEEMESSEKKIAQAMRKIATAPW